MAVRIISTGNSAEQIAPLLEASGLFHAVSYDSSSSNVTCLGADGNPRFSLRTLLNAGSEQAVAKFYISSTSYITDSSSLAATAAMAVEQVLTCRHGVILSCVKSAVLLTKNNLGENLYVISSTAAQSRAEAVRNLRVYSYGDQVRNSYPVNLACTAYQRDGAALLVPFVSDSGSSDQPSYAPHAFFMPVYQYGDSGTLISDARRYLTYAGCWAVSDD